MRTVVYKEVEGGLILAIFVQTYYVDDPYFTSQKQYLRLEGLFKSANTAYRFFLISSLDINLTWMAHNKILDLDERKENLYDKKLFEKYISQKPFR